MPENAMIRGETGGVQGFEALAGAYLRGLEALKYSGETVKLRARVLKGFSAFLAGRGVRVIQDAAAADIEAYTLSLRERSLSPWTVDAYARIVRMFLRHLEREGELFASPAEGARRGRLRRTVKAVPSVEDMRRLLAQPDTTTLTGIRDRALFETAYSTGARISEIAAMDLASLDLGSGAVRVMGKGRIERMVPLTRRARLWIGRYVAGARSELLGGNPDEEALWLDRFGRRAAKGLIATQCHQHSVNAGIRRMSMHAIRRACATHMLRNGAHPLQIQTLLGHATAGTLGHYLEVAIPEVKATHRKSKPGR